MKALTEQGQQAVNDIAARYNLSTNAVMDMLQAVVNGGGTMAQFNIPELGGSGQWMQGGMTMVGDMFNYGLQNTVNNLCNELSNLISSQTVFREPTPQTNGQSSGWGNWWPTEFGMPTSSGSQNNVRYAYFASINRLVLDYAGNVSLYDTLDHQISGISQQQGGGSSVQFTSQYGLVNTLNLPLLSGPGTLSTTSSLNRESTLSQQPSQSTQEQTAKQASQVNSSEGADETLKKIEQMADLLKRGILNQEEFDEKKAELLARL